MNCHDRSHLFSNCRRSVTSNGVQLSGIQAEGSKKNSVDLYLCTNEEKCKIMRGSV